MADPTPASPFDSEFESWLHTASLGAAPMRGTNLPPEILDALRALASNENATQQDQDALREQWAQVKRDNAARELEARDAAVQVEANTTLTPADPMPAPGQENNDDTALLEPDVDTTTTTTSETVG